MNEGGRVRRGTTAGEGCEWDVQGVARSQELART